MYRHLYRKSVLLIVIVFIAAALVAGCYGKTGNQGEENTYETPGDNTGTGENNTDSPDNTHNPGTNEETGDKESGTENATGEPAGEETPTESTPEEIDYNVVKPDESGKIMVVMFHNFINEYEGGDKEFTMTYDRFRQLLEQLYQMGYRLISMSDYYNNNISVPAGCIPMIFTFDDGRRSQFNLIEKDGELVLNPECAVGILQEFNREHPDFGMKGTFYISLGLDVFTGAGTTRERLEYLTNLGFEIGNHTYTHVNLKYDVRTVEQIQKEIGANNKTMTELIEGYQLKHFSLPFGDRAQGELEQYIYRGEYQGVPYENLTIVEVAWSPALSPVHINFNPLSIQRVRAPGITPVDTDLDWWLARLSRGEQYVSDGNPSTIVVPSSRVDYINPDAIADTGKELIVY